MAIDRKYGNLEIDGIPHDEPVFIIRAQDAAAVPTIEDYANNADLMEASTEFIQSVNDRSVEFRLWAAANPDKMKTPD